jgi:hypothetical protein
VATAASKYTIIRFLLSALHFEDTALLSCRTFSYTRRKRASGISPSGERAFREYEDAQSCNEGSEADHHHTISSLSVVS